MDISSILVIVYFVIGFCLSIHWFNKDYKESYDSAVADGNVEKGMSSIMMLGLMLFWPIELIMNCFKKKEKKS